MGYRIVLDKTVLLHDLVYDLIIEIENNSDYLKKYYYTYTQYHNFLSIYKYNEYNSCYSVFNINISESNFIINSLNDYLDNEIKNIKI